MLTKTNIC